MNMITERTSEKRNGFSCHCISKQRLKNILYKDENKQNWGKQQIPLLRRKT